MKSEIQMSAYGHVDELNTNIGLLTGNSALTHNTSDFKPILISH